MEFIVAGFIFSLLFNAQQTKEEEKKSAPKPPQQSSSSSQQQRKPQVNKITKCPHCGGSLDND